MRCDAGYPVLTNLANVRIVKERPRPGFGGAGKGHVVAPIEADHGQEAVIVTLGRVPLSAGVEALANLQVQVDGIHHRTQLRLLCSLCRPRLYWGQYVCVFVCFCFYPWSSRDDHNLLAKIPTRLMQKIGGADSSCRLATTGILH